MYSRSYQTDSSNTQHKLYALRRNVPPHSTKTPPYLWLLKSPTWKQNLPWTCLFFQQRYAIVFFKPSSSFITVPNHPVSLCQTDIRLALHRGASGADKRQFWIVNPSVLILISKLQHLLEFTCGLPVFTRTDKAVIVAIIRLIALNQIIDVWKLLVGGRHLKIRQYPPCFKAWTMKFDTTRPWADSCTCGP